MSNYERYVDRLFDENNDERITVADNDGKEIEFEQVAVVDFDGGYYAVLKPTVALEGVGEDEVLTFYIDEENDCLVYEEDESVIDGVYAEFIKMLEDADEE
ncbi:MAG: DUF1292 domain-containing protein [Clostridia bacterium]|nr:DUF1292 domain-containing protein [Clostridia bacterium]